MTGDNPAIGCCRCSDYAWFAWYQRASDDLARKGSLSLPASQQDDAFDRLGGKGLAQFGAAERASAPDAAAP
jgi:hypothetical protein